MAAKTPDRDLPPVSAPNSGEYLAKSRVRRSNAGARMSTLIDQEADDELALLFAEQEDDEEYEIGGADEDEGVDEDEDEEMGEGEGGEEGKETPGVEHEEIMSDEDDDEEDQGPDAEAQDYEGEKELERQARELRRAEKRKAREGPGLATIRKKVRIDPSAPKLGVRTPTIPAPRQRKKSERISWLPTLEDGPVRSSSRKQTMENKEMTHARLKESAVKRQATLKMMQAAAEKKAQQPQKILTQEDRLREAAKTERLNAKSLNRWEETEKRRAEEQKARLLALQNRRLDGPVVTWWSGIAKWINDKLAQIGHKTFSQASEELVSRKRKPKEEKSSTQASEEPNKQAEPQPQTETQTEPLQIESKPEPVTQGQTQETTTGQQPPNPPEVPSTKPTTPSASISGEAPEVPQGPAQAPPETPKPEGGFGSFLDGIQLYASMNESPLAASVPASTDAPVPTIQPAPAKNIAPRPTEQPVVVVNVPSRVQTQPQPPLKPEQHPPPPPKTEYSSRTSIILQDFDDLTPEERGEYNIFFNLRKAPKLQKPPLELCQITSIPARYRDPQTGLAYANARAYDEIRQLVSNRYSWSNMLGCFVGPVGVGARGVPERFLWPNAPPRIDSGPSTTTPGSSVSGSASLTGPASAAAVAATATATATAAAGLPVSKDGESSP